MQLFECLCLAGFEILLENLKIHGSSTRLPTFAFFSLDYNFILNCQSPLLVCELLRKDRVSVLLIPGMQLGLSKHQLNERPPPSHFLLKVPISRP